MTALFCVPPCLPVVSKPLVGSDCFPCGTSGGGGPGPNDLAVICPTIPSSAVVLTADTVVRVPGQNFTTATKVWFDNVEQASTVYVSPAELTFTVQPSTEPVARTATVTVRDGTTTGVGSCPFQFTAAPILTVTCPLVPATAVFATPDTTVRVNGLLFTAASKVWMDGTTELPTTFVDSTKLDFVFPTSTESAARTAQITVRDGAVTAATSCPFVLTALLPIITCPVAPISAAVGSAALPVTVTGQNFTATSKVWMTNAAGTAVEQPTAFVSATELTATINPVSETARIAQLTVRDTTGTSATSCPFEFTAVVVPPIVTELLPACVDIGSATAVTVRVLGQNFLPTSVVQFDGAAQATIYSSATELRVSVTPAMMQAHTTVQQVTVSNSGTVSTPAVPLSYFAAPTITNIFPDFLPTNNTAKQEVTITGTNFVATGKVFYAAALEELPMTYVSATELKAQRDPTTVGNESGSITVATCTNILSNNYSVQSNANPTLNLLDPTTGPVGTTVSVYAENAGAGTDAQVLVNGALVPTIMAGNIPTFVVTAGMTGTINVSVRTHVGNGDADVVAAPLSLPFVVI